MDDFLIPLENPRFSSGELKNKTGVHRFLGLCGTLCIGILNYSLKA